MSLGSMGKTRVLVDTAAIGEGDSIASYLVDAAGTLLTSTLVGAKQSLDVRAAGTYAEDSAHASGDLGLAMLAVRNDAGTALAGTDGDYIPFSTTATGALRVAGTFTSAAEKLEDSAHVSGDTGFAIWGVRNDAGTAFAADGDYVPFSMNAAGALRVAGTFSANAEKAEDAAHSSGDTGNYILSVRQDTAGSSVSANGDYASFQQTKDGYVRTLGIAEQSLLQTLVEVDNAVATLIPATPLTNRKHIIVQNVEGLIYLGSATVTTSGATQGIVLAKGGVFEADISDAVSLYGIAGGGSPRDVAVLELA